MAENLPAWVYDIVIDLLDHQEHPKLVFESGAFEGTAPYDWCPCKALENVPADVIEKAEAIRAYMEEKVAQLPPPQVAYQEFLGGPITLKPAGGGE